MDAIVTARVPVAVKEQVGGILRDMGSTPSQLVNAAYEFVLAEHRLPQPRMAHGGEEEGSRELDAQQRARIAGALRTMYLGPLDDGRSFDESLREARDERYAAFA